MRVFRGDSTRQTRAARRTSNLRGRVPAYGTCITTCIRMRIYCVHAGDVWAYMLRSSLIDILRPDSLVEGKMKERRAQRIDVEVDDHLGMRDWMRAMWDVGCESVH